MKDFKTYLNEKKKDTKKAHSAKKGEGADDKKFIALMVEYKKLRRNKDDRVEASKVLEKAMTLAKEGDVSDKTKIGVAYL